MGYCLSKIYICIGDLGIIGLGDGLCVIKDDLWIIVFGDVDEFNLIIGVFCV